MIFPIGKILFFTPQSRTHIKDWWETYYEHKDEREPSLFSATPTWNTF